MHISEFPNPDKLRMQAQLAGEVVDGKFAEGFASYDAALSRLAYLSLDDMQRESCETPPGSASRAEVERTALQALQYINQVISEARAETAAAIGKRGY